jgi:uncharacterized membrane protein YfcA
VNAGRQVFEFLKMASEAHARWEYEVSLNILRNRKRVLLLLFLLLPILAVAVCEGATMLGGKTAYAPAHYSTSIFLVSIVIGLCAGLITGCIGAGGGFIITPALMAAGIKGILAVGTDLFHIFAKAIMGTAVHRKLGNVSVKLAIAFLVGSGLGTVIGGTLNKALYNKDPLLSDTFISVIYSILLGFLGFYALFDFLKSSKGVPAASSQGGGHGAHGTASGMTGVAMKLQNLKIPPLLTFDEDLGGRKLSGVIVALGGLVVGVLAAVMGVGGGFVTFPMFPDHFHGGPGRHRPVRDLRVRFLHAGHGDARRLPHRHPSGGLDHQSRQRGSYSGFLRHLHFGGFCQPGCGPAPEADRTGDR